MKRIQKYLYSIGALLLAALAVAGAEYGAGRWGLELRTFAQEIKGIYLWLVMPLGVLAAVNGLVRIRLEDGKENPKIPRMARRVLLTVLVFAILVLAFCRGVFYAFSAELVEEEKLPGGYLKGTWSGLFSETQTGYYELEAGVFRRPFSGWSREELSRRIRKRYGPAAEYVEGQAGGWHVFRLPDPAALGEFIYFHVSDGYEMGNNGDYQILISEAAHFWKNRNRRAVLGSGSGLSFEEARDTGAEIKSLPQEKRFYITCYDTEGDISACAADLTDWLQFVKNTGQYPRGEAGFVRSQLAWVQVGSGDDYFSFDMGPEEELLGEGTWEEKYNRMRERLSEAFGEHQASREAYAELLREREAADNADWTENDADDGTEEFQEAQEWNFMDTYDGDYEKECQVGDGQIRYRMVVEDAALGSRFYGLLKSTDGGESWQMSNTDPFDQQMGQGIDFTFLNEKFGFASLMHNGGDQADLYVTKDGGESYQLVVLEGYTVSLENGFTYDPYDYPGMPYAEEMPYREGSAVYVLCGQGADGDYNGGDEAGLALYRSTDGGYTFTFVEIRREP